ncbi:MAG: hypothetical protein L0H63_14005, partial [Nitrococcus sp.]|nr:hypothetical protein [Nitrococcus sp.]
LKVDCLALGMLTAIHKSLALLVYVSAWLKRFEPAAFTCELLNSQPMGFYAPAQLVRDEDETGLVNVVIWKPLVERFRRIVAGARLLGVVGIWERHGEVTHLIAGRLEDHSHLLGELTTRSRDFH